MGATTFTSWQQSGYGAEARERKANDGYTLSELHEIADNVELWARLHAKIPDRVTKDPIPLIPSPLQKRMFRHYHHCQRAQSPCRMIVVKIRRGGGSTGMNAIQYVHAHNYGARLGGIGTTETVSMNMFQMMRFFDKHDSFPGWKRSSKILETGKMEWPNGSSWEKYTADNPEAARSAGLQGYHGTECGRWSDGGAKDAKETLRSMLGAVPRRGFTVVGEESTAQGANGAFYDRFQGARWPTHKELGCQEGREYWRKWEDETPQNIAGSDAERALQFVRVFSAWFEDDENKPDGGISIEDERFIAATLDEKEIKLIERYKTVGPQGERLGDTAKVATLYQQLAWRRSVIATEFEGDVEAFEQENPSSPKEAFASSGWHTFNRQGVQWMMDNAKQRPPEIGVLEEQHDGGIVFRRTDAGEAWFQMWEEPRVGYRYLQAVDTMSGISNVKTPEKADYHAALVGRAPHIDDHGQKKPLKVVGSLVPRCQLDPDMLASRTDLIHKFYGRCLTVPEINNTGHGYRQEALKLGMNLYRREEMDKFSSQVTEYVGWVTDKETRPQLITTGKKYIRNNARPQDRGDGVECYNLTVVTECQDMIRHPDGKDAAPGSKHDDHAMAFLILLQCIGSATYFAGHRRRRTGPADRANWKSATPKRR